ncbi:MAG: 30S ribosomal protein S16, partial [Acidobacteriota bacterium]|nr:30S ribosomal protein S16 [Acidobacteriota bacterium]
MLKIRLRRMGSTHSPFYRVVVSGSRRTPRAAVLEEIGHYDPLADPPKIHIDGERVEHWVGCGAEMTPTVKRLVRRQRVGAPASVPAPVPEPVPASEPASEPAAEVEAAAPAEVEAAAPAEVEAEAPAEVEAEAEAPSSAAGQAESGELSPGGEGAADPAATAAAPE